MRSRPTLQRRQGGTTLLISLIFLVILTLFAVSGMNTGVLNLRTANNAQMVLEAEFAAQRQIEQVMNSMDSFITVVLVPTTTYANVNGDLTDDFKVVTDPLKCLSIATAPGYSYEFAGSAPKDTVWQVTATATDLVFGATVTLRQGVKVRLPVSATCVN